MKRKIFARIWDRQNKKWLSQKVDIFSEEMRLCLSKIDDFSNFEISPYTGQKDTDGREIWEGDYMLTQHNMYVDNRCLCVIEFCYNRFTAETVSSNVMESFDLNEIVRNKEKRNVIGNRYEDNLPELIEKIYHPPVEDSKLNESANDQTKVADWFEAVPSISTPKIKTACTLCRCQAFDEAHMSDPMCVCGHNMSSHGMG